MSLICKIPQTVHKRVRCDGCNQHPLLGTRWKCTKCDDFDFCQSCYATKSHNRSHTFEDKSGYDEKPVPITSIEYKGTCDKNHMSLKIIQVFSNQNKSPLEAIFTFPIHPDYVINGLVIEIDDRIIQAQVMEKTKSEQVYDDAISEGHGAYLLSRSNQSNDVVSMSVGNLLPSQTCKVTISIVSKLINLGIGQYQLVIPTVISSRYNESIQSSSSDINSNTPKTHTSIQSSFDITGTVERYASIESIQSNVKEINISKLVSTYSIYGKNILPNRDIIIDITTDASKHTLCNELCASIIVEPICKNTFATVIDFTPLVAQDILESHKPYLKNELIFLVDQSGSMDEMDDDVGVSKIELVKRALVVAIKSIQPLQYFNIIGFGSNYNSLFPKSVQCSKENIKIALDHVQKMQADLGM